MVGRSAYSRRRTIEPQFAFAPGSTRYPPVRDPGVLFGLSRASRSWVGQTGQIRSLEVAWRAKCRDGDGWCRRHSHECGRGGHFCRCAAFSARLTVFQCHHYPHPAAYPDLRQRQFLPGDFQSDPTLPARWVPDSLYAAAQPPGRRLLQVGHLRTLYHSLAHFPVAVPGADLPARRLFPVSHLVLYPARLDETYCTDRRLRYSATNRGSLDRPVRRHLKTYERTGLSSLAGAPATPFCGSFNIRRTGRNGPLAAALRAAALSNHLTRP